MGGATRYRRADGVQAARSSYQGQFASIVIPVESVRRGSMSRGLVVQSCRGMSLSEVRYTPEGFEVRVLIVVRRVFTAECRCRMTGSGVL